MLVMKSKLKFRINWQKKQYSDLYFKDSQTEEKINRVIRYHDDHRYADLALPASVLFHEIDK